MQIEIYDTIRDGSQSPDMSLKSYQKLRIAQAVSRLAAGSAIYEELGWPGSNPEDQEVYELLHLYDLGNMIPTVFGATRKVGISAQNDDSIKQIIRTKQNGVNIATIFGKADQDHVVYALNTTLDDNLAIIKDSVEILRRNGLSVFFDAEHFFDGFRKNRDYALRVIATAAQSGAERLILCDTNGGTATFLAREIIEQTKKYLSGNGIKAPLGVHFHNDSGMAVANSLEAILSCGVPHVQGCIFPVGERTGNADLTSIIARLHYGKKEPEFSRQLEKMGLEVPDLSYGLLKEVNDFIYTVAGISPDSRRPFVGAFANKHSGGVHQDAEDKHKGLYTAFDLSEIGNDSGGIVLGLQSGTAHIAKVAERVLGTAISKKDSRIKEALYRLKRMSSEGYQIGFIDAEQELLIKGCFGHKMPFRITNWSSSTENIDGHTKSEAYLEMHLNGDSEKIAKSVKDNGPVNAMYLALLEGLGRMHRDAGEISIEGFNVSIARENGAASSVRVYVEFGDHNSRWGTVGVSTNVIEAAKEALEKGINYHFLRK